MGRGTLELSRFGLFSGQFVILLCGRDKRTQRQDVKRAKVIAEAQ